MCFWVVLLCLVFVQKPKWTKNLKPFFKKPRPPTFFQLWSLQQQQQQDPPPSPVLAPAESLWVYDFFASPIPGCAWNVGGAYRITARGGWPTKIKQSPSCIFHEIYIDNFLSNRSVANRKLTIKKAIVNVRLRSEESFCTYTLFLSFMPGHCVKTIMTSSAKPEVHTHKRLFDTFPGDDA